MKINNFDLLCKNEGHEIAILMMHGYGANKEDLAKNRELKIKCW